ncbi:hypothetical protein OUZ56_026290 [Daphnia magna]|uniref:Uncharacterized protein n=1 Tax=Daphnia magna TaxID=35525 RepID=A0ABQ9ZLB4_9CRUS|nr:hypothetical protein OUZ56_026290 [Daphnia magna]
MAIDDLDLDPTKFLIEMIEIDRDSFLIKLIESISISINFQKQSISVFEGFADQFRQQTPFSFKKTSIPKFGSERLHRFGVNIKPAVLNSRSHAADDGKPVLYSQ